MDIQQCIYESTLYIHNTYAESITITDIAAQAFLSPSYFSVLFRTLTGYTVKNYLNRYRLYRAALDLQHSGKRLIEIAYANGFSSQQAFTRSFSQMYGVAPAQFRLLRPKFDSFPSENLWTKWRNTSMKLMNCFENVRFMRKDAYYVAGIEVDIHYNTADGTAPIGGLWDTWNAESIEKHIPNRISPGVVYGMTHSETADNKGKYLIGAEVSTLNNLPLGLIGRRFEASDFAVFDTTLEIIMSGDFWRTFYAKWLPESGYVQPDESLHDSYCTFNKYPAIEVYPKTFDGSDKAIIQIIAPVVKQ